MHKTRWTAVVLGAVVLTTLIWARSTTPSADLTARRPADPVATACALPQSELIRLWRGFDEQRSEDIVVVPRSPNYFGSFQINSHTGPWDYVQEIPLILYGPGWVHAGVESPDAANLVDVYPTIARLLGKSLPERSGSVLSDAVQRESTRAPKLVVVVMWDGVGTNVLERWPDAWPNLRRLAQEGTSYSNATVGSSPSITPASHSSLGTGAWPREHRVTAIRMRIDGHPGRSFRGLDPRVLARTTFADELDREYENRSEVALVGWQSWHLGMLGHGAALPGGDRDTVAIINKAGGIDGNQRYFSTPNFLSSTHPGIEQRFDEVDKADGAADGQWLGHDVTGKEAPSWIEYETDVITTLLKRGDFGADRVPDFLFANFKITDVVGHLYTMDSPEMEAVLTAQDRALGRLLSYLQRAHDDFALVLSADHGHTPSPETLGAWPISQSELIADMDAHFQAPEGRSFVLKSHAAGFFLDGELMMKTGTEPRAIARWLNSYTLGDNATGGIPAAYSGRVDDRLFSAAFPGADMGRVMRCAFGASRPPPKLEA